MACTDIYSTLQGVSYDCNVAFGGIVAVKIEGKDVADASKTVAEIEFNTADAFSNASETKTVSPDGSVSVAQTLQIEIPKLEAGKYGAIDKMKNPNFELKVYILTKAGKMITFGDEYGCYLSTIDVASGTGRQDKNRIQLTFTGDEAHLAPVSDTGVADFNAIKTTAQAAAGVDASEVAEETPKARTRRIIEIEE